MKVRFFYAFITLSLVIGACLIYGFFIEPKRLIIRNVSVTSNHYSGQPIKIALLSDIHIGGFHTPPARITDVVSKTNGTEPDIILLAGDFINGHTPRSQSSREFNAEIETGLVELSKLRTTNGGAVYAVMGNHDNLYSSDFITQTMMGFGFTVLRNDGATQNNVCIIGMADFDTDKPTADGYENCAPDTNKIVLTHSPDSFSYLRSDTAFAVAGHTHGGQINLPMIGRRITLTRAGEPLAYGLKAVGMTPVFVSAGIGTSLLPARFRAPPEIVVITLSGHGA